MQEFTGVNIRESMRERCACQESPLELDLQHEAREVDAEPVDKDVGVSWRCP